MWNDAHQLQTLAQVFHTVCAFEAASGLFPIPEEKKKIKLDCLEFLILFCFLAWFPIWPSVQQRRLPVLSRWTGSPYPGQWSGRGLCEAGCYPAKSLPKAGTSDSIVEFARSRAAIALGRGPVNRQGRKGIQPGQGNARGAKRPLVLRSQPTRPTRHRGCSCKLPNKGNRKI